MTPDPFLPVAPARVKTLVLPIGRIKRDRFDTFVKSLNTENVVQLRDVTADGRPNRSRDSMKRSSRALADHRIRLS